MLYKYCTKHRENCTEASSMVRTTSERSLMCALFNVKSVLSLLSRPCCVLCALFMRRLRNQLIIFHADEKPVVRVLHDTCEALGGRKRIPWLSASFSDFKPQRTCHGPPVLAPQCSRGPPACPATESTRKDPRAEEQKMPMCKIRQFGR